MFRSDNRDDVDSPGRIDIVNRIPNTDKKGVRMNMETVETWLTHPQRCA